MPSFSSQSGYDVRFEWGEHGLQALAGEPTAFAIVDVLSFSTCVALACARGAAILPYPWKAADAAAYAAERGALLAGARGAPGALTLSPRSLASVAAGTRLVLPSPNGSELSFAAARLGQVFAGSLRNAASVAARLAALPGPVAVIAAGERWPDGSLRPALEDLLGAGAIIARLHGTVSPEAALAQAAFERAAGALERTLFDCASGRELVERGFPRDVALAAELDTSPVAPRLAADAFSAEPAP
ncbi:MAG TPA: 2-phosphosulfolactate phosphatase [Myxococcota bacterium]|nr:2-phosphosulfolactate phosphatase [Myxococcota bacterium]